MAENAWIKRRLQELRKKQVEVAALLDLPEPRITEIIKGIREVQQWEIQPLAAFLEMTPAQLMQKLGYASRSRGPVKKEVPVVGYVGAGGRVYSIDDHELGGGIDSADQPPDDDRVMVAVIIRGTSMVPVYRPGDRVYYAQTPKQPGDLIGADCVVKTTEGEYMLKVLKRHAKRGLFTLHSYNADPILGVALEFVYPVAWLRRDR